MDVPKDAIWLDFNHFRAVLDLQFTPDDFTEKSHTFIRDILDDKGIKYLAVPMTDDGNNDLDRLFTVTSNQLEFWDGEFQEKRSKILVKCGVGVSRSVAVLIDYLCKRDRLTYAEAKSKIANVDKYNYGGMPIGIDSMIEFYLRARYPNISSAFGDYE